MPVDYDALAAKFGGRDSEMDYDALAARFGGQDATPATEMQEAGMSGQLVQALKNNAGGVLQGFGNIGQSLMRVPDRYGWTGYTPEQRKAAIQSGIQELTGADKDSAGYVIGQLAPEIAGTAGVGGAYAKGAQALGAAPKIVKALESGGMVLGDRGGNALVNALTRIGAGSVVGGSQAALINPETAATGAVLGGAMPIAVNAAGTVGSMVFNRGKNAEIAAALKLAEAAGDEKKLADAIAKAKSAGVSISGKPFTLGQAGKNAGLSATERARFAVNPENYQEIYDAQRAARVNVLRNIAKDEEAMIAAQEARKLATEGGYGSVEGNVYTDTTGKLNKFLKRMQPSGALREAQVSAATRGVPFGFPVVDDAQQAFFRNADDATQALYGGMPDTGKIVQGAVPLDMPEVGNSKLLAEIRKLGGLSTKDMADLVGERATNKAGAQVGVFTKKGEEVGDMVRRLVDRGVMPREVLNDVDGGAQALRDAIQRQLSGGGDDMAMRALAESYYGAPQELLLARDALMKSAAPESIPEQVVGKAVKGIDLINLKKGLDAAISKNPSNQDLLALRREYMDWLGGVGDNVGFAPEYTAANKLYADMSKPINQMQIGQKLLDTLTGDAVKYGAEPGQRLGSFMKAISNADALAKRETGMRIPFRKIMEPEQSDAINRVAKELARETDLQNLGRGIGSDTVQKAARNNMLSSLLPLIAQNRVSRTGQVAAYIARMLKEGKDMRTNAFIDAMMQNPEFADQAYMKMMQSTGSNALSDLFANHALRSLPVAIQANP